MTADRQEIKELLGAVAASQRETYDRASEVWSYSFGYEGGEDWIYGPLWLLWGGLTDWVEVKPEETDQAEAKMREAAQAFLAVANDDEALTLYFDRWLYEEMGGLYPRPEPPPKNPPFGRTK